MFRFLFLWFRDCVKECIARVEKRWGGRERDACLAKWNIAEGWRDGGGSLADTFADTDTEFICAVILPPRVFLHPLLHC